MTIKFEGETISWRGPAPYVFIEVPEEPSKNLKVLANEISYGWGCIPVSAKIGKANWNTSLMPRNGKYMLPIKMIVQKAENIEVGVSYLVTMEIG